MSELINLVISRQDLIRCVEALDTTIELAESLARKRELNGKPAGIDVGTLQLYKNIRTELNHTLFMHVTNASRRAP